MKKYKPILFLIILGLILTILVSCKDKPKDSSKTSDTDGTTTVSDTNQTTNNSDTSNLPESDETDETTEPKEVLGMPESVEIGKVRVQLLSKHLVRIEVAMSDGSFQDKPSFSVVNRDAWPKVEYTTEKEGNKTVVKTEKYNVYVPNAGLSASGIYVTDKEGTVLWRYETVTDSNVYLPSPSDELNSWYFCDNPRVIPAENGYSIPSDGYKPNNGWKTDVAATDIFVFLPDGNYETFTRDFVSLTGRSEMITLDFLGYWDSRWYAYSEETALKQIKDYQQRGYSIDILVIDTDWRDASSGIGYNINKKLFPNMAKFLAEAHKLGVSIVFNDHPEPAKGTNSLLDKDEIEYRTKNLTLILALGLDYWWYDRNWSVALKGIDSGLSIYCTGMYAFQWITEQHYESLVKDPQDYARRALIMANVDGILNGDLVYAPELAAHKYSIQWTGDIGTSAESLKKEIYNAIYGGVELGLPYVSADLGGHTSEVTKEMYVRWIQYGALSTITRVHCTKPYSRMPWVYGDLAESVTKTYVGMKYRLMPLYYFLAHDNYETGLPIMRRLDIKYPQYAEASRNDEYLLGDYILVAPIDGVRKNTFEGAELSSGNNKGLFVEYFNNNNLSGTPAYTGYDESLNHDWGSGGPKELNGRSDNFSIRWTGKIKVKTEGYLQVFADDGIRVWINDKLVINGWTVYDQYLSSEKLNAGETYDIKIEYCEYTGQAHVKVGFVTTLNDEREVFLPDGRWIDVWTGQSYVGPATITVSHPLATSPIFVRAGAIIPLLKQEVNTKEQDWSKITLDIYPSVDYEAKATIYEDDATTVAYKDGKFRTTDVTMKYADGALNINIGAAKGTFKGASSERTFTIRLHARSDWGKITKITVNGETVTTKTYTKSETAHPFMETGPSPDSDIIEFAFKTDVTKKNVIKVYYESTKEDGKNESYDNTALNFKLAVTPITKALMQGFDISSKGNVDWALFGAKDVSSVIRKKDGKGLIGSVSSDDKNFGFNDNYEVVWSDGDTYEQGRSTNGIVSKRNFHLTLKTEAGAGKTFYTLYVGGWKSVAKITVRDRAGNVKTLTFGDLTSNYYRQIIIECDSDKASELYINYSILCGENITFSSATVSRSTK